MQEAPEHRAGPLPPKEEILQAAYVEQVRYAEETLKQRRKKSSVYTYIACAVAAGMIDLVLFVLLHRS